MRVLYIGVLLAGCSASSADLRPLDAAIGAAVSLGAGSSIAMTAMTTSIQCASVKAACSSSYPCSGEVSVALGAGCPLPLGGEASGTVDVMGSWHSADSASLSNTFVGASAGTKTVAVVNATNLTVSQAAGSVSVRYTWQNVNVKSGASTLGAQSSWTVDVDLNGTPGDPSDDSYTISGTDQGVSGSVSQLSATGVVVQPACRLNPVAGSATIQKVSTFDIEQSTVNFHAACDGKADVTDSGSAHAVTLDFFQ